MVRNWIRNSVVAVGFSLVAVAASATTVTDAMVDINGTYGFAKGRYSFSGDFSADLLGRPKVDRLYDIGITFSLNGKTAVSRTFRAAKLSSGPFSVRDVLKGEISGKSFSAILRGLDVSGGIKSQSTSANGDFDFRLNKGRSKVLYAACLSVFSRNAVKKCTGPREFGIQLELKYDQPEPPLAKFVAPEASQQSQQSEQPAPVPLPAGLPLLGAGVAALAALRRARRN